jgi:hypothetical protein
LDEKHEIFTFDLYLKLFKELLYKEDYHKYELFSEELNRNPSNHLVRCKMIDFLHDGIYEKSFYYINNDDYNTKIIILNCAKKYIDYFNNNIVSDKKLQMIQNIYNIVNANICYLNGNFYESLKLLYNVLNWHDLHNNIKIDYAFKQLLYDITFSIIQLYSLLGMAIEADIFFRKYKKLYEEWYEEVFYGLETVKNETVIKELKHQMVVIKKPFNAHEFHILNYNSYDKGIIYKSGYDYASKKYSLDFIKYFSNVFHWSINKTSNSLILFDELMERTFYEIPDIDEHIRDNKDMIELYF